MCAGTLALGMTMPIVARSAHAGSVTPTTHPAGDAHEAAEHIDSYDVRLRVQRNGNLHVTEAIRYDFGGGATPRHGIVRTIPLRRHADGDHDQVLRIRHVEAAGQKVQVTSSGDETTIKIGDPAGTVSGGRSYVIGYDVPRALVARGRSAELYWNAIGTRWEVPISAATVTVSTPLSIESAACYRGAADGTASCADLATTATTMTAGDKGLRTGQGITVRVDLLKNGVSAALARL